LPPTTLTATHAQREHDTSGLICRPLAFDQIARSDWDRLFAATPGATPFARWTVHRAWWEAYG